MALWCITTQKLQNILNCVKGDYFVSDAHQNGNMSSNVVIYPKGYNSHSHTMIFLSIHNLNSSYKKITYDVSCNNVCWKGDYVIDQETISIPLNKQETFDIVDNDLNTIIFTWNIKISQNDLYQYSDEDEDDDDEKEEIKQQSFEQYQEIKQEMIGTHNIQIIGESSGNPVTLKWIIPQSQFHFINPSPKKQANSVAFDVYSCIVKLLCFANKFGDMTLHLMLLEKPDYIASIAAVCDLFCIELNQHHSSFCKIAGNKFRNSVFPTGLIERAEIIDLHQISFVIQLKILRISYKHLPYDGFFVGSLLRLYPFKMHRNLTINWQFPITSSVWNMSHGKYLVRKRKDIWRLSLAPNGFWLSSVASFTMRLTRVISPQCSSLTYIDALSIDVTLSIIEINYVCQQEINYERGQNNYDFVLPHNHHIELKENHHKLTIQIDINVIDLYDSNLQRVDPDQHDIFIQDDAMKLDKMEQKLEYEQKVQIRDDDAMKLDKKVQKLQYDQFKEWFDEILKLPQYFQSFIENGWDSLEIIKDLKEEHLDQMNITKIGHKIHILKKIQMDSKEGL